MAAVWVHVQLLVCMSAIKHVVKPVWEIALDHVKEVVNSVVEVAVVVDVQVRVQEVVLVPQKVTVTLVKENALLHVQVVVKEHALQDALVVAIQVARAVVKVVVLLCVQKAVIQDVQEAVL